MVDSGSVRRESQDAGLHELELLDDTVAQDASGWGAITVARAGPREGRDHCSTVASGSVRREHRDAGSHELGLLGGHCSTVRLGMRALTVARVPRDACDYCSTGCLGTCAITVARAPREACDGKPGLHDLALLGDTVAQYDSGSVRSL